MTRRSPRDPRCSEKAGLDGTSALPTLYWIRSSLFLSLHAINPISSHWVIHFGLYCIDFLLLLADECNRQKIWRGWCDRAGSDLSTQILTYLLVGSSFALYIGIAVWTRAASTRDFYIAGGGVNPLVNGMATAADWMSAASFISMAGIIAFMGRDGSVYLLGWTGGYVLLALLLAPYLRKFGQESRQDR